MPRNVQAIYQTLCWNPELREQLTLFPYALGDEEASCAVMSIPSNVANGNVVCSDDQMSTHQDMEVHGATHTVRLGDYLGAVRSDVMKIDVEGFEPMVLRGAGVPSSDALRSRDFLWPLSWWLLLWLRFPPIMVVSLHCCGCHGG